MAFRSGASSESSVEVGARADEVDRLFDVDAIQTVEEGKTSHGAKWKSEIEKWSCYLIYFAVSLFALLQNINDHVIQFIFLKACLHYFKNLREVKSPIIKKLTIKTNKEIGSMCSDKVESKSTKHFKMHQWTWSSKLNQYLTWCRLRPRRRRRSFRRFAVNVGRT